MNRQSNYLLLSIAMLFLSIAIMTLVSCGSDSDSDDISTPLIYGSSNEEKCTWAGVEEVYMLNGAVKRTRERTGLRWTFYKNGTFIESYTYNSSVFSGTYKIDGSSLTTNFVAYWSGQTNVTEKYTIEKLSESELILKSDYPDTEYDYSLLTLRKL